MIKLSNLISKTSKASIKEGWIDKLIDNIFSSAKSSIDATTKKKLEDDMEKYKKDPEFVKRMDAMKKATDNFSNYVDSIGR